MRGAPDPRMAMLSTLSTEDLIPADDPTRRIRLVADAALADLDETFDAVAGLTSSQPPPLPRCDGRVRRATLRRRSWRRSAESPDQNTRCS
jgi:hypothetical protein